MATIELRRKADGTKHYRVKIRIKGTPPVTESFARLTDARKWAQITEVAIRDGKHFGVQDVNQRAILSRLGV